MNKVLLVYKRSFLEKHRHDPRTLAPVSPAERKRLQATDVANRKTIHHVHERLMKRGLRVDVVWRGVVSPRRKYDLVVTVGGDGTFFLASHFVLHTPILGVNSDPRYSLGLHCGANAKNFAEVLGQILAGKARITKINRLSVTVNGRRLPTLVVNDILFAHRVPGAMSRYTLRVDGRVEEQRSSGVWIATAAGSTAGIRAAGGKRIPITSQKIQYMVREPYSWPRAPRMVRGYAVKSVGIACMSARGAIWIDGANRLVDLVLGDRVTLRTGATPLKIINLDEKRRRKLFP